MRDLRRAGAIVAATALLWAVGVPTASAGAVVGSLTEGQPAFWSGAFVPNARVSDPSLCGIQGPCFDYGIRVVPAKAKVLRVAINTPDDSNGWELRLLDPSGHEAATGSTYTLNGVAENFDVEVFAHNPAPGVWTAQVIPQNVSEGSFSGRAAVQGSATRSKVRRRARRVVAVPPDLAPDPPWHVTFEQPPPMVVVEGGNYTAMAGVHNPTMQAANQPVYRCLPEETIEQNAQRCLRFTSGFASLGPGPFEVYGSSHKPGAVHGRAPFPGGFPPR